MWRYDICDQGGVYFYKNNITRYKCEANSSIEINLKNSIKYVSDLIPTILFMNPNNDGNNIIELVTLATDAINKLTNIWIRHYEILNED